MAKRLSIRYRKRRRDIGTLQKNKALPKDHKIAVERSKKALFKKNNRAA